MDYRSFLVLGAVVTVAMATNNPTRLVRLSRSSLLRGKVTTFRGVDVNLFLGVPYAKPPVGNLRFKKPVKFSKWDGVRDATAMSDSCYQLRPGAAVPVGSEDCLHLDITVPTSRGYKGKQGLRKMKKAVVIYFPGGLYQYGAKTWYFGAPLAVHGDVIVVTVNYRVGPLGFLSEGPGSGNFGLWDQHMAIKWVKKNIRKLGGNPNRITIFGESAGAGSVSAHTMSRHSNGLFKRAIQMSGTLYAPWSWYLSDNERNLTIDKIRSTQSCGATVSLYDCLRKVSALDLLTNPVIASSVDAFHPIPDNDFLPADISEETFTLPKRFDLLSGFNGQEGLVAVNSQFTKGGPFYTNGVPPEVASAIVFRECSRINPDTPMNCVKYLIDKYGLASISDNKQRAIQVSYLLGDLYFVAPVVRDLDEHRKRCKRSTYGYYFNEKYIEPEGVGNVNIPDWIRMSTGHYDMIPFIFGGYYIQQEYDNIVKAYTEGAILTTYDKMSIAYYNGTSSNFKELNDITMTTFTNFIKSGNPNYPSRLPRGTPRWPQYHAGSNKLMEFSSKYSTNAAPVATPHKDRLDGVSDVIFGAAKEQTLNDKAT